MFICIMDHINRECCAICSSEMENIYSLKNMPLHLFSFKTPALRAVMSEEGVADCAFSMRNGVKLCCVDSPEYDNSSLSFAICKSCNTIQLELLM